MGHLPSCASAVRPAVTQTGLVETIEYDVGKHKSNYCLHVKTDHRVITAPIVWAQGIGPPGGNICIYTEPAYGLYTSWLDNVYFPVLVLDEPTWESKASQALQIMWPRVEEGLSSINSILELKDIKSIIPLALKVKNTLNSLPQLLNAALQGQRMGLRKTLKRVVNTSADLKLNYEFAIRPMIGDLQALWSAMADARKAVDLLLKNEGKDLISHCRLPLDALSKSTKTTYTVPIGSGFSHRIRLYNLSEAWYTATLRYRYTFADLQREQAHVRGLMDRLGVNLNPAIIWNAIPWSFAVDWVLKVSNFLEQFQVKMLEPKVEILGFVHSRKISYQVHVLRRMDLAGGQVGNDATVETYEKVVFERRPFVPNYYTALMQSGVSSRELILASSLLVSRLTK